MRRISFNLTTPQIVDRSKTVTRRLGWLNAKVGERLHAVDRLRSKDWKLLAVIEIVSVRREKLNAITDEEVIREGNPFPRPDYLRDSADFPRKRFIEGFCSAMKCYPDTLVTRIEFRYVEPWEIRCTTTWPKGGGLKGRFQCGLMEDHDGDHSALIPSNAPWLGLHREETA